MHFLATGVASGMIDTSQLEELRMIMGAELPDLFRSFERDNQRRFVELESALERADSEVLRRTAHTMKGGALGVGASELAAQFKAVEDCAKRGDLAAAAQLLPLARQSLLDTMAAFEAWL